MIDNLSIGLLGAGFSFLVGCLLIGVQIALNTKNFEEEYHKKIEKIKLVINWRLERALRKLFKNRFSVPAVTSEGKWTQVFPETLDDIRFKEGTDAEVFPEFTIEEEEFIELVTLDQTEEIYEYVNKLRRWSHVTCEGKEYLRKIGRDTILIGIITSVLLFISVAFLSSPDTLFLLAYIFSLLFIFLGTNLYKNIKGYRDLTTEIDDIYEKFEKRSLDI